MRTFCALLLSVITFFSFSVIANGANTMAERFNVGGYLKVARTTPHTLLPSKTPRTLSHADGSADDNNWAKGKAERWFREANHATGLLLIHNSKIVFEDYKGLGNSASEFYSMSIGKSLSSLAVGKAYCNGALKSLDTLASEFVPEIKNNNLGRSTIRQLLMMSSGNWMTSFSGQPGVAGGIGQRKNGKPFKGFAMPARLSQVTVGDYLWGKIWKRAQNKNYAEPGQVFIYSAADTLALSKVIEKATGISLAAYFDTNVWQPIHPQSTAHWEADNEGTTIANSGFHATLRDWGRLAIWILEQHSKKGCFGDYLRKATSTQIKNAKLGSAGHSFDGYGYQWWTGNEHAPGFWGLGFAGQFLGINPETSKIIIKFSYKGDRGFYSIFRKWHEQ
jgi:CubicO group peptidase (beta-lactamase class C family)